ncbi:TrkH family potassium uptake protein [Hoyosella sp. YIM 151337]|uniref:TrkH family potassium uptake protein n=1 Tax=Hoyosella sp. YIM 151337 TaxID=2992742 RepID=UPI002235A3A3|nr:potassium transporter TrkG [Hoyosella sp. YIM 151337]MCW4352693.1 TrkH family potassium uptake protein [Hoyosella sp. YIM 151337]
MARFAGAFVKYPARVIVAGYLAVILLGTALLSLPAATAGQERATVVEALFTATSAACITGLVVVDTGTFWAPFGHWVIVGLFQIGGLGIMTVASLLGLLVARRMGMRMQLIAHTEQKNLRLGEIGRVVTGVVKMSLLIEAITAVFLVTRYYVAYADSFGEAAYWGVFHAISAFNSAGFALQSDSMMSYVGDPLILIPVIVAFTLGAIGFPVIFEVTRHVRQQVREARGEEKSARHWTVHTKITILAHGVLGVVGMTSVIMFEWANPSTMGPLSTMEKLLAGAFQGLAPRSIGFNTIETGDMNAATVLITDVLMFIGGGSASTAGGIKVTTFALLGFVILAELRGQPTVHVMGRKLADTVQRQALTVALLSIAAVMGGTIIISSMANHELDRVLFEVISAFCTVGLSMGITDELPPLAQLVLVVLMFAGRIGPIILASALALQERPRRYELPEERPIVG